MKNKNNVAINEYENKFVEDMSAIMSKFYSQELSRKIKEGLRKKKLKNYARQA
jgi:DNA invertase Pin-like site-specific DNA recombinase